MIDSAKILDMLSRAMTGVEAMDFLDNVRQMAVEHGQLRQQLADMTAECRRLEHDVEVANAHRRIAEQQLDRLRAELLQQPPTLEWLRATFGGQPEVTAGSTGYNVYRWSCGVQYRDPHGQVSCPPGVLKRTRAAVLEAVAETKIESEVK